MQFDAMFLVFKVKKNRRLIKGRRPGRKSWQARAPQRREHWVFCDALILSLYGLTLLVPAPTQHHTRDAPGMCAMTGVTAVSAASATSTTGALCSVSCSERRASRPVNQSIIFSTVPPPALTARSPLRETPPTRRDCKPALALAGTGLSRSPG